MAGHSKWKNTKRRKAVQDAKKEKIFSKLIREVRTATKVGGKDVLYNSRLRMVLQKASSNNVSKHILNRAIFRGSKELANEKIVQNVIYEGYGPGGTAILLQCITDNSRRIVSEIRYALSKYGGNLGIHGSVAYLFSKKGIISCVSNFSEDIIIDAALKVGAYDVSVHSGDMVKIYINSELLQAMEIELRSCDIQICEFQLVMIPYVYIDLNADNSLKCFKLIHMLKKIYGVCDIYHNAKFLKNDMLYHIDNDI
ncbi:YebC/PmpR family DNA-binding transcriptional regulator [Blochmannia endosymbiont of Polyrhachis (Hedomyrma) turneri]|uniref:YebC/PmpR family DNA-binding transcriptional regulator n=1 Tax=Blochmannia endosymbiont of Polyrhachis (Hedomyrma) turneri TaxID=1505596 RepID=UPI00061A888C|nr:YebC/PmpR family DNA-binding transcriptional regulator [Blochmannia endosymbiont of Polyrhachis (Hedomyrma) turneri]AKC60017.1 putative transcriptional regulator [Blochmannia endosymbiont of Polyrhachis (Hedomyrma) turneri]